MLIRLIYPTTSLQLPLIPDLKKSPKLMVLDTGLINYFVGLQEEFFRNPNIDSVYQGKIAEHITAQNLISIFGSRVQPLVFWVREKRQSKAEIDFLIPFKSRPIPLEVKAGKVGKLRSLHLFIELSGVREAIRIYSGQFSIDEVKTPKGKKFRLFNIPFYLIENWQKILEKYSQD